MIQTFGAAAARYAHGLGDVEAIVTDAENILPAYMEAVKRRTAGDLFYGMVLVPDRYARITMAVAAPVAARMTGVDDRYAALAHIEAGALAVNGRLIRELWTETDPGEIGIRAEFFSLCDAVLVRSYREAARLGASGHRMRPIERILVEPALPPVERVAAGAQVTVVVWGPRLSFDLLAFHGLALQEFAGELVHIGSGGTMPDAPGAYMSILDPDVSSVLARASVIVCADPEDPGDAVAHARRGYGIVAPASAGADEFVRNVVTFDPTAATQLWSAVSIALTRPAEPFPAPPPPPRAPAPPVAPLPADALPLVSVVIPTYNRPDTLEAALRSVAMQRYPNVEMVVVNDAGQDVSHVVAAFPRARLVNNEQNAGCIPTSMTGVRHARGEYVHILADDDLIYPDHLERLVFAMIRTGASAAHANTLIRYEEQQPDGSWISNGFNAGVFNYSTTPTVALVCTPISGQSICHHRRVFERLGPWREDSMLADQEWQLRLWNTFPVLWVDHMTSEWRLRGKSNLSASIDSISEMERIYSVLHPTPPDRPLLAETRNATLENVRSRPPGFTFSPSFVFKRRSAED